MQMRAGRGDLSEGVLVIIGRGELVGQFILLGESGIWAAIGRMNIIEQDTEP